MASLPLPHALAWPKEVRFFQLRASSNLQQWHLLIVSVSPSLQKLDPIRLTGVKWLSSRRVSGEVFLLSGGPQIRCSPPVTVVNVTRALMITGDGSGGLAPPAPTPGSRPRCRAAAAPASACLRCVAHEQSNAVLPAP